MPWNIALGKLPMNLLMIWNMTNFMENTFTLNTFQTLPICMFGLKWTENSSMLNIIMLLISITLPEFMMLLIIFKKASLT
jgi:hypothetical protein